MIRPASGDPLDTEVPLDNARQSPFFSLKRSPSEVQCLYITTAKSCPRELYHGNCPSQRCLPMVELLSNRYHGQASREGKDYGTLGSFSAEQ